MNSLLMYNGTGAARGLAAPFLGVYWRPDICKRPCKSTDSEGHQLDTSNQPGQDRVATEAALQEAALRLLDRHGVLAGLNLREVAKEAGVNRGLVYHYFGSRAALLRKALRRNARGRINDITAAESLPFRQRVLQYWRTIVGYRREVRLATLLLLDSRDAVFDPGEGVTLTPVRKRTLRAFAEDQRRGEIDEDIDLDGLHAVVVSLVSGYAIYREELARSAKVSTRTLDKKAEAVFERMLEGIRPERGESGTTKQDP